MPDEFEKDLEAVFEERAADFSPELRELLKQLWRQGELTGRRAERKEQAPLAGGELSECGRYWCVPLNQALLVTSAVPHAWDAVVTTARKNPGGAGKPGAGTLEEFRQQLDRALEELGPAPAPAPSQPFALPAAQPKVRQPANQLNYTVGIDLGFPDVRTLYGDWSVTDDTSGEEP